MGHRTIKCMKCGTANGSDTVFCSGCGTLLSALEGRRRRIHAQHVRGAVQFIVVLLVVCLLALGGLVMWPHEGALGEAGGAAHARQTALLLSSLHRMASDTTNVGRDVRETDLNAYIKYLRLEQLPFDAMSVDLLPNKLVLRLSCQLASWTCKGYCLTPTLTRDYTLGVNGDVITIEQASLGHLPLPPILARKSYAWLMDKLADQPELDLLAKAQSVTLHKDRLHVTFGSEN